MGAATGAPPVTAPHPLRTPLPRPRAPTRLVQGGLSRPQAPPSGPGLTALLRPTVLGAQRHPHMWHTLATPPSPPHPCNRPYPALKTAPVEEGEPDLHTSAAVGATAWRMGLLQRARPRLRASRHRALGSMWPSSPQSEGPFPRAGLSEFRHTSLQPWSAAAPRPPGPPHPARPRCSEPPNSRAGWGGRSVARCHIGSHTSSSTPCSGTCRSS